MVFCTNYKGRIRVKNSAQGATLRLTIRLGVLSVFFCASALYGQVNPVNPINYDTARLERQIKPLRISETITLDARMDEPAWSQAPVATDFIQNDPRTDNPASEKTEVRVLYDNDNPYFGVYAYDSQTGRIIISDLRKDFNRGNGDAFEVVLDTFGDRRNGYQFATNAAGAKWDAQMVNEGRETNANWDGIWNVRARVVEDGWVAEIAIPFRTLKFRSEDVQTWGINFQRKIRHRNEDSYWSPLPRIYDLNRVSLAGTLSGMEGVRPGANFRIKPYVVTGFSQPHGEMDLLPGEKDEIPFCRWASGGHCFNTDFGVDVKYSLTPGLTWDFTYNTDFAQVEADEQQINLTQFRLFFPEKREFFLENSGIFQFGAGWDRNAGGGRASTLNNDLLLFHSRTIGIARNPETGDTVAIPILGGTRLTGRIGSSWEVGFLNIQQKEFGDAIEATNFTVARLKRNILANSDIGVMFVNKEEMNSPHFNRVLGFDANFRFGQSMSVNGFLAKSFTEGGGDDNVAGRFRARYTDTKWDATVSYTSIQEDFVDEMGFVPRTGVHKLYGQFGRTFRPERFRRWLRQVGYHNHFDYLMNRDGDLTIRHGLDHHIPIQFQDGSRIELGMNPTMETFDEPFTLNRNRGIVIPAGTYSFNEYFVTYTSDESRAISGEVDYFNGHFYTGYKHSYTLSGTFRLGYRFATTIGLTHHNINLPQGHYKTNLITARVNYSFSTNMFLNALIQYNNDTNQVSSNIRFNLIHRPLSDLFVVYNERRTSISNDLVDRALILKFTYMVAR